MNEDPDPEGRHHRGVDLKACGILVYRDPPTSFLLMRHADRWDLPKGHAEPGESERETALRELQEETGISPADIRIDDGFRFRIAYTVTSARFNFVPLEKEVILFLAKLVRSVEPVVSEHTGYRWFEWNPPHRIQERTIDPLLAAVERYWNTGGRGTGGNEATP